METEFSVYSWILENIAVIEAAILLIGVFLTIRTLKAHKQESKNLATLNLIIHQRSDEKFNKSLDLLTDLIKKQQGNAYMDLSSYLLADKKSEEAKAIFEVLNFREFVAVGINSGIIDEKTYKRAYCSVFVRDWENLKHTVEAVRKDLGKDTMFQDFEKLATKWKNKPLKNINKKLLK